MKPCTMKKRVLLFGSTGNLGQFVFWELIKKNYDVTVVVRDKVKAVELFSYLANILVIENESIEQLPNELFEKHEIVVSLLGNRISHPVTMDQTCGSDFLKANESILKSALRNGVEKFGLVTPFQENNNSKLSFFKKHTQFKSQLLSSGINYTIINSNLLFSSISRQLTRAELGKNMVIGAGNAKLNPIYDGDLAEVFVDKLAIKNVLLNAGGPEIFTRMELAQKLQSMTKNKNQIKRINSLSVPSILPYLKVRNPIMYERMAHFYFVNRNDFVCTPMGSTTLQNYLNFKVGEKLKNHERMRLLQRPLLSR